MPKKGLEKRTLHSNFDEVYQFANLESILKPASTRVVFSVETINQVPRF